MKNICLLLFLFLSLSFVSAGDLQDGTTRVQPGEKVPDFTAYTIDGKKVKLSQFRGKVVLINFFTTWCGPCLREMTELEKEIWQPYRDKGLVVLAIGREETRDKLVPFRDEKKLTFTILPDPDRKIFSQFATQYIPRNFLIDRKGQLIYSNIGYTREGFASLREHVRKAQGD